MALHNFCMLAITDSLDKLLLMSDQIWGILRSLSRCSHCNGMTGEDGTFLTIDKSLTSYVAAGQAPAICDAMMPMSVSLVK